MKKISVALVVLLCSCFMISCNNNKQNNTQEQADYSEFNYTTNEILQNIKDKMGEAYLPNVDIDQTGLEQKFGIDMAYVEEFSAQEPMIGFHPDKAIIVKAKQGCADKIEKAFIEAKEQMVGSAMQYPTNLHKTNSATIIKKGNYVAFLLLGLPDDGSETEQQAAEYAQAQVKVAVDAFEEMFK